MLVLQRITLMHFWWIVNMQVNVGGMCKNGHTVPSYGMRFFYNGFVMVIITFVKDTLSW